VVGNLLGFVVIQLLLEKKRKKKQVGLK
jgi:hypothetical protein